MIDTLDNASAGHRDRLLRFEPRLRRWIVGHTPRSLARVYSADDVLSDVWVRAVSNFATLPEADTALFVWLRYSAHGRITDAQRHYNAQKRDHRRDVPLQSSMSVTLCGRIGASVETPSSVAAHNELAASVQIALASIRDDWRQAIVERHLQGASIEEIARRMGRTPDSVKALLQRGMARLRVKLRHVDKFFSGEFVHGKRKRDSTDRPAR